jgi:hypothetical protein
MEELAVMRFAGSRMTIGKGVDLAIRVAVTRLSVSNREQQFQSAHALLRHC